MPIMGPSEIPLIEKDSIVEKYNEALGYAELVKVDLESKGTSGNFKDLKKCLLSLENVPDKIKGEFEKIETNLDSVCRVISILKSLGAVEPISDEQTLTPPSGMDKMPLSSKKQPAKKHYLTKNKEK